MCLEIGVQVTLASIVTSTGVPSVGAEAAVAWSEAVRQPSAVKTTDKDDFTKNLLDLLTLATQGTDRKPVPGSVPLGRPPKVYRLSETGAGCARGRVFRSAGASRP